MEKSCRRVIGSDLMYGKKGGREEGREEGRKEGRTFTAGGRVSVYRGFTQWHV